MQKEQQLLSEQQESFFLNTFPLIRRITRGKLGNIYRDRVEDIVQRIGLNLWRWKSGGEDSESANPESSESESSEIKKKNRDLSQDEWLRLANTAAHNEINSFYRSKYRREEILSESLMNQAVEEKSGRQSLTFFSPSKIEGNSREEVASLLNQVWKIFQTFSLKRKYSYLLGKEELIINFITYGSVSRKAIAESLEMTVDEFDMIIKSLPLSDGQIGELIERKIVQQIEIKQVRTWRAKAKRRLAEELKDKI